MYEELSNEELAWKFIEGVKDCWQNLQERVARSGNHKSIYQKDYGIAINKDMYNRVLEHFKKEDGITYMSHVFGFKVFLNKTDSKILLSMYEMNFIEENKGWFDEVEKGENK